MKYDSIWGMDGFMLGTDQFEVEEDASTASQGSGNNPPATDDSSVFTPEPHQMDPAATD